MFLFPFSLDLYLPLCLILGSQKVKLHSYFPCPVMLVESQQSKCLKLSWCAQAVFLLSSSIPMKWTWAYMHRHRILFPNSCNRCAKYVQRKSSDRRKNIGELRYFNINSLISKYKGEGAVKRYEVQLLFFYAMLFLRYVSQFFVMCVRLSTAMIGWIVFCLLDKMQSVGSILTPNHIKTWLVMSDTLFTFMLS